MKKTPSLLLLPLLIALLMASCASLPASTATLTREVIKVSNDRYTLNIALINQLFEERKDRLNTFINDYYTPKVVENYQKLLPDSLNYKEALPQIVQSIIPVISRKKDSLQGVLDQQKNALLAQMNKDYQDFTQAATSLQNLIDSSVSLQAQEKSTLASIEQLTGIKEIDVQKIENTFDQFLNESGNVFQKILPTEKNSIQLKK